MQNQPKLKLNPVIIIATIFEIAFFIFAAVSIHNILEVKNTTPAIRIDDYSEITNGTSVEDSENVISDISDTNKATLEQTIYNTVSLNNPSSNSISNRGAVIREGSVHQAYLEEADTNYLEFIVDLEDLGQSYQVVYRTLNGNTDYAHFSNIPLAMVFCPKTEDLIYGDFGCKDSYNNHANRRIVYEALQPKEFDNFSVGLIGDVYNGDQLTLSIFTESDEESVKQAAISELSGYISSLGFDINEFEYVASSCGLCQPQD